MESRGHTITPLPMNRPAIPRRSIGCGRGSPCSNCLSAKISCTHSAVAVKSTPTKQRVLISAEYEQKIDGIAKGINNIQTLLQARNEPQNDQNSSGFTTFPPLAFQPSKRTITAPKSDFQSWDHSVQIVDFVRSVVGDQRSESSPRGRDIFNSLKQLVDSLEGPPGAHNNSVSENELNDEQSEDIPPLEAVVTVLRWAKDRLEQFIISLLCRVLPMQKWTDICQRVYFAVDGYSEIDLMLANGYLSYIFSEHSIVSGHEDYAEYGRRCKAKFHRALSKLPLLMPANMEAIAVLTLGTFDAIETSRATMAWVLISAASNMCQSMGYHRASRSRDHDPSLRASQESLFWSVYKVEKSLALRLGRSSTIRDSDITIRIEPQESRATRLARLQGKTYDQLYNPGSVSRNDSDRGFVVNALASELRGIIEETRLEFSTFTSASSQQEVDPMRRFYLQCDLIGQNSLLALILRGDSSVASNHKAISDDCLDISREVLEIHHELLQHLLGGRGAPSMVLRYLNWGVLHTPFVPFSILFTNAVRTFHVADLARLDRFAASLQTESTATESRTHPHQVYRLLCEAAHLCFDANNTTMPAGPTSTNCWPPSMPTFGDPLIYRTMETYATDDTPGVNAMESYDLSDWYYENQQIMRFLDNDEIF